jgi:phage terminase large subunit-like protein
MKDGPTNQELKDLLALLSSMDEHKRYNKILYFEPAEKQRKFLDCGSQFLERGFLAGNRVGKSETGAFEVACHATGNYPEWWQGARFDHPTKIWVCGISAEDVRKVGQTKLCGQFGVTKAFGTGLLPKASFADKPSLSHGVTDAYDTIQITHCTNGVEDGVSVISFKSYEQKREKFQGEALDVAWCDEEPPMDIYSEILTRLEGVGLMLLTFTALKGETDVYKRYKYQPSDIRTYITMSLDEASWYSEKQKRNLLEQYPEHERNTRRYGLPMAGIGPVFKLAEELIKEPTLPFQDVPPEWSFIWGIDFGISKGHPFAAVLVAHDREIDCIHVLRCLKLPDTQPIHHATAMLAVAANVPVSWPQDGTQRVAGETGTGKHVHQIYKGFGLRMLPMHAQWAEGGYSTEAAVKDLEQRMTTGKFKVGASCTQWFDEYRHYHRDLNNIIVKTNDDLLSATMKALMMLRYARSVPLGGQTRYNFITMPRSATAEKPDFPGGCIGVDFDLS